MKKIYAVLVATLMTCSLVTAQEMYDSFDDVRTVTYGLNIPFPQQMNNGIGGMEWPGWHGTLLQYAVNPGPNDVNDSPSCAEYTRNPSETYDVILIDSGELGDLAPYLAGEKTMTMDVYAPVPGITVQISLQNAELAESNGYPGGRHSEYQAITTTGGEWETLEFTLTGQPWTDGANAGWWPDAPTANVDCDEMVLLFNPGVNVSETYYFDNLMGAERAEAPCEAYNEADFVLMDADCDNDGFVIEYTDGRMSIFPDPALDQDDKCLEYARNGGAPDDVVVGNFAQALNIPVGETTTLYFDFWDPAAPSTVLFSIQDDFGLELILGEFVTTTSLQWETFSLDLAPIQGAPNATDFVILIEPGQELAETFYIDNLIVETLVNVEEQSSIDLEIYPNPTTGLVNIKASEQLERYDVYNSMGSLVASDLIMQTQMQIDLSYLSTGLYTVHVTSDAGVSEQKTLFIQP
ncbi:MAG: T9SS type A sorting domain-containing protein [Flavobacteriales bacterium]|nr:T9SS type A sorting domain-containing protein [Flavobacteriales bacterium]